MANSLHISDKNSKEIVKRFESHEFLDEDGDEYGGSSFGGFGEYFRKKKIKLQNRDAHIRESYKAQGAPQLFKGMAMYINGYTQPSLTDLTVMIVRHGGIHLQYLDGKTQATHIIASALTPKKKVEFAKYKIVKPAWIVESIEAGELLPWSHYRVVEGDQSQSLLGFGSFKSGNSQSQSQGDGRIMSQRNRPTASYREFTGKKRSDAAKLISRSGDGGPGSTQSFGTPSRDTSHDTSHDISQWATDLKQASPILEDKDEDDDVPHSHQLDPTKESLEGSESEEYVRHGPSLGSAIGKISPQTLLGSSQDPFKDDDERLLAMETDTQMDDAPSPSPKTTSESPKLDGSDTETPDLDEPPSPSHKKPKISALEHNTKLLSNPKVRQNTVLNPEFLANYYSESRLHHLSQWKADLKSYFQSLTSQATRRSKPSSDSQRYILHVDFDCFFASVSAKTRPDLAGKPIGVGHSAGPSSEIASCNYTAREFGVKNGMWMKQATQLCPDLTVLPYDFPAYETASKAFYSILMSIGATVVQSVSIDEALLDITNLIAKAGLTTEQEHAKIYEISKEIRDGVREKTGCEVSVGAGANVLLAKLALRKAKPGGQYHLKPDEITDFLAPLKVRDLPGVGYNISQKLQEDLHIETVGELRDISKEKLKTIMGPKTGERLYENARGIDKQEVGDVSIRKSVTVDVNWGVRFENSAQVTEFMYNLASELCRRLAAQNLRGSHLSLKLMKRAPDAPLNPPKYLGHGHCDTYNKSAILGVPTNDKDIIGKEMTNALKTFNCPPEEIRGLGIMMTKLIPVSESAVGSSQKKLDFGKRVIPNQPGPIAVMPPPPVQDKGKGRASPDDSQPSGRQENTTPIRLSKPSMPPMMTQFLVPTQVDPEVLESLPDDMKERIVAEQQRKKGQKGPLQGHIKIKEAKPQPLVEKHVAFTQLPAQSQLDMAVLDELPEDIRAEILAEYQSNAGGGSARSGNSDNSGNNQSYLPQTPHKNRLNTTIAGPSSAKKPTPKKKVGTSGVGVLNFRKPETSAMGANSGPPQSTPPEDLGIDPTVLAELPSDIREEVIAQARAEKKRADAKAASVAAAKKTLSRPTEPVPLHPSPSLSARGIIIPERKRSMLQGLNTLEDVRNLITSWYNSARADGPHVEDVEDVVKWLRSVVSEERDVEKAVNAVRWFEWVVGEAEGHKEWSDAVEMCRVGVKEEGEKRGLRGLDVS